MPTSNTQLSRTLWTYFASPCLVNAKIKVRCKICDALVDNNRGSTSGMYKHLSGFHSIPPNKLKNGTIMLNFANDKKKMSQQTITLGKRQNTAPLLLRKWAVAAARWSLPRYRWRATADNLWRELTVDGKNKYFLE